MRRLILTCTLLTLPALAATQAARFEVASVKLNPNQSHGAPRRMSEITLPMVRLLPGGTIESRGYTLRNLIAWAYELKTGQSLVGKQDVLQMEYDISAKAATSSLTALEARAMLRTLLEERFQLRWRLQPHEIDSYALVPARDDGRPGPALRLFTEDCAARATNPSVPFESPDYESKTRCGGWSSINNRQRAVGISTTAIAERLTSMMLAPVSDRTGWAGLFTFDIVADNREMPFQVNNPPSASLGARLTPEGPLLLDVFSKELGLKLKEERSTVNDFVVEKAEAPTEN
jgi:uncharacterized protein (TIGR03435 family)